MSLTGPSKMRVHSPKMDAKACSHIGVANRILREAKKTQSHTSLPAGQLNPDPQAKQVYVRHR